MILLQKLLNVVVCVSLLSSSVSAVESDFVGVCIFGSSPQHILTIRRENNYKCSSVPPYSLWGKVVDFSFGCSHVTLKPDVSIPALQEFTVCFHLKFEVQATSPWTAFIYYHPDVQRVELGLGGGRGRLVVWLFGTKWTTPQINLGVSQWFSVCLTWSQRRDRPALYIRGVPVGVTPDRAVYPPPSSYPTLAANGTLVLGVGRPVRGSDIQILPFTGVFGKISLFRLWGRERNKQEVTSLYCTEGDVVNWETDNWDTRMCPVVPDPSLQCEWSFYEVRMMFAIICYDGNNTELYTAREMAHHWIREVLPTSMYLNRVSVFEVSRSSPGEENPVKPSHEDKLVRWVTPNINRFQCLVHVSVIPSLDVSAVQSEIYMKLKVPYYQTEPLLQLLADGGSIHTTPIENFSTATTSPPSPPPASTPPSTSSPTSTGTTTTSSPTTSPTNVSELYFEVKVNVSITGDCEPEQILSTWLNSSLPDDMMMVLDFQLLPKTHRYHPQLPSNLSSLNGVQVLMSLSDSQEMEEQIRGLLLSPYDDGSVTIATEDIEISRILILKCHAESHQTRRGLFQWPDTSGGKHATQPCPKNPRRFATRHW